MTQIVGTAARALSNTLLGGWVMDTAGRLATTLDQEMLEQPELIHKRGWAIAPPSVDIVTLPDRAGGEVAEELGGRHLVRYMTEGEAHDAERGLSDAVYVSPTPYTAAEARRYLALRRAWLVRPYVMLIDPAAVDVIRGPHWVRMGFGIEYLLPHGYRPEAVLQFPTLLS